MHIEDRQLLLLKFTLVMQTLNVSLALQDLAISMQPVSVL